MDDKEMKKIAIICFMLGTIFTFFAGFILYQFR